MYENLTYEQYLALYSSINPAALNSAATHWNDVAASLSTVSQALAACRDGLLQSGAWTGDGAASFGAYMDALVQQTSDLSSAAGALSTNISTANSMVDPATSGDFPAQPPPASETSSYQQWQLPHGEIYTGTASQLRQMLTNEAYERVNLIAASFNSSAMALSDAQGWAPTSSEYIDTASTPNSGGENTTTGDGGTSVSGGRNNLGGGPVTTGGGAGAAAYQPPTVKAVKTVVNGGYEPQPEFSPLMVPQGGPVPGTGTWTPTAPRTAQAATGGSAGPWTVGNTADGQSGYTPGLYGDGNTATGPGGVKATVPGIGRTRGTAGNSVQAEEPGISGGKVGPGTIRRPGMGYTPDDLGDGIVGGVPVNGGGRSAGRGFGGTYPGRASVGGAEDGVAEGSFGAPGASGAGAVSGGRLNASLPEDGAVGRPSTRTVVPEEPEPHYEMPMYPGGGMGAGAGSGERKRNRRPNYLVQKPRDWIPEPDVVPPVIE